MHICIYTTTHFAADHCFGAFGGLSRRTPVRSQKSAKSCFGSFLFRQLSVLSAMVEWLNEPHCIEEFHTKLIFPRQYLEEKKSSNMIRTQMTESREKVSLVLEGEAGKRYGNLYKMRSIGLASSILVRVTGSIPKTRLDKCHRICGYG